jgi:hypothetical protein
MPKLIALNTFSGVRGSLSVLEDFEISFGIRRIFYIYGVDEAERGGHRHIKTHQALICLKGSCSIRNDDGTQKETYVLDSPSKCLILYPQDWHVLYDFSQDAILLVLASELYNEADYIFEPYS